LLTKHSSADADSREDLLLNWPARQGLWLRGLERAALAVENLINRLTGDPRLNPFYHTGQIAVFLLVIVGLTGLYLFFFYQYGFDVSYQTTRGLENRFISRIIRAVHRYGSVSAIIVSLLHAFRLFFMGRFRGPRWLAWVSGVLMVVVLWLCGVSGYWMVWDQRAQLITTSLVNFFRQYTSLGEPFALWLLSAEAQDQSWILMAGLLVVHLLTAVAVGVSFIWLHVRRLNRPKYLLEPHWLIGLGVILVLISIIVPLGMLPQADLALLPGPVTLDPIFLFFLPIGSSVSSGWLWGGLAAVLVALAVPWLSRRRQRPPQAAINQERCTGCARCVKDCPYTALSMTERAEGESHQQLASVNPDLCVSCSVCLGSCPVGAISLGDVSPEAIWQSALPRITDGARLVFTCERHTSQSRSDSAQVVTLPCVAAVHPDLLVRAVEAGAAEVTVLGCPPEDCAQRGGSLRAKERIERLKATHSDLPITFVSLPPGASAQAPRTESKGMNDIPGINGIPWRNLVPAFVLLAVVLSLQVWLTDLPYMPYADVPALIQVAGRHPCPARLVLEVDEQLVLEKTCEAGGPAVVFEPVEAALGEHYVRLTLADVGQETNQVLFDGTVNLEERQVLELTFGD
jgi:ferredoxin